MSLIGVNDLPNGRMPHADVCVAGAGPAGLALALALAETGHRVLLLESGGLDTDPETTDLSQLADAGPPRRRQGPMRDRRFGGTAWYGRTVALDPLDFESREWVPHSGWPMAPTDIAPYVADAAAFLGIPIPEALSPAFWSTEPARGLLDGGGLAARIHLVAKRKDLGRRHRAAVAASPLIQAVLHATVVDLEVDPGGRRVLGMTVRGPSGGAFSAHADRYVLACGGLENAQLLLATAADHPTLFGRSEMALGRFLMDHPRVDGLARLRLNPAHPCHLAIFRRLTEHATLRSQSRVMIAAGLSEATQRREQLLNASAFFYAQSTTRLATTRRLLDEARQRGPRAGHARLARDLPLVARAAFARLQRRPFEVESLAMVEQLEQAPRLESRVTLSDERDRAGRRRLRLDWRVGAETLATERRFHRLLADCFAAEGVGTLESPLLEDPSFVPDYGSAAHPMGATRMSRTPDDGVVTPDLRTHAIDNLFVAGSSVFPTGGHANPTLTIVALSLRLAAHLGRTLRTR